MKITPYIFNESLIGLKWVDAFSSMYTVSIGTSTKSIWLCLNSRSMLVSYSNLSPFTLSNNSRYCLGIALNPVCVSEILSPHANLNTKLVMLFPNLLLNGTSFPEKFLTPRTTLSLHSAIFSQHFMISAALCWLSPSTVTTPSISGLFLMQYSNAVLRPRPLPLFTSCVRIVHSG